MTATSSEKRAYLIRYIADNPNVHYSTAVRYVDGTYLNAELDALIADGTVTLSHEQRLTVAPQ